MHALAEPPVSPTVVGAEGRDRDVVALDQRRVVVRLRDGETILVGGSPSYEDALVLARPENDPQARQGRRGRVADAGRPLHRSGRDRLCGRPPPVAAPGNGPGRADARPAPRTVAGAAHRRTVGDDPEQVDRPRASAPPAVSPAELGDGERAEDIAGDVREGPERPPAVEGGLRWRGTGPQQRGGDEPAATRRPLAISRAGR